VASIYDSLSKTAQNLINNKFGKSVILKREIGASFNPATGTETGATEQTQTIKAVDIPASGGKIQALDKRFNLGALTYNRLKYIQFAGQGLAWQPELTNKVEINGEEWFVIGATPLEPNSLDNSDSASPILIGMALRI
jgi:hypothetical protein